MFVQPIGPGVQELRRSSAGDMTSSSTSRALFHRIRIPAGLERTLEDLSREVLRHQPQDIYLFSAEFFERRIAIRKAEQNNAPVQSTGDDVMQTARAADSATSELPDGTAIPQSSERDMEGKLVALVDAEKESNNRAEQSEGSSVADEFVCSPRLAEDQFDETIYEYDPESADAKTKDTSKYGSDIKSSDFEGVQADGTLRAEVNLSTVVQVSCRQSTEGSIPQSRSSDFESGPLSCTSDKKSRPMSRKSDTTSSRASADPTECSGQVSRGSAVNACRKRSVATINGLSTPASVQSTPASEQLIPASDQLMPASEQLIPASDQLITASVQSITASVQSTPASVQSTTASVQLTPSSVQSTPAAVQSTTASVQSTPASVQLTPASVQSIPAYVQLTPAAVQSTPASVKSTHASVKSTPASVQSTPASVESTPASVESTSASVELTPVSVESTTTSTSPPELDDADSVGKVHMSRTISARPKRGKRRSIEVSRSCRASSSRSVDSDVGGPADCRTVSKPFVLSSSDNRSPPTNDAEVVSDLNEEPSQSQNKDEANVEPEPAHKFGTNPCTVTPVAVVLKNKSDSQRKCADSFQGMMLSESLYDDTAESTSGLIGSVIRSGDDNDDVVVLSESNQGDKESYQDELEKMALEARDDVDNEYSRAAAETKGSQVSEEFNISDCYQTSTTVEDIPNVGRPQNGITEALPPSAELNLVEHKSGAVSNEADNDWLFSESTNISRGRELSTINDQIETDESLTSKTIDLPQLSDNDSNAVARAIQSCATEKNNSFIKNINILKVTKSDTWDLGDGMKVKSTNRQKMFTRSISEADDFVKYLEEPEKKYQRLQSGSSSVNAIVSSTLEAPQTIVEKPVEEDELTRMLYNNASMPYVSKGQKTYLRRTSTMSISSDELRLLGGVQGHEDETDKRDSDLKTMLLHEFNENPSLDLPQSCNNSSTSLKHQQQAIAEEVFLTDKNPIVLQDVGGHNNYEKTDDNDYDPMTLTQSLIFPDDLVGDGCFLRSEQPTSPFPGSSGQRTISIEYQDKSMVTAVVVIQSAVKGWKVRKQLNERQLAATKIQALFRGHNARKHGIHILHNLKSRSCITKTIALSNQSISKELMPLQNLSSQSLPDEENEKGAAKEAHTNIEVVQAAVKIQAMYRGWKVRTRLRTSVFNETDKTSLIYETDSMPINQRHSGRESPSPHEDETTYSIQSIQSEIVDEPHVTHGTDSPSTHGKQTTMIVDPEQAAIRIQAGYRGWLTRKQNEIRPTMSSKQVAGSGAVPVDYSTVHETQVNWLDQELDGKKEPRSMAKNQNDVSKNQNESMSEDPSSWLVQAQSDIKASFQGLRTNVTDALKAVEETARLVSDKGSYFSPSDGYTNNANSSNSEQHPGDARTREHRTESTDHPTADYTLLSAETAPARAKTPQELEQEEVVWMEIKKYVDFDDS